MKGLFITFEGPDGSGKTTQVRRLVEELESRGYDILTTREPGGTAISDKIRSIILDPGNTEMVDQAEVLLYAASRAQHVHEKIRPALAAGKVVICDRFIDASISYQGYGLGMDKEVVESISRFAASGLQPDRTYLLDVPVEVSRSRLVSRTQGFGEPELDRIERKGSAYHERVRRGFHELAAAAPERIVLVRGDRPEEEVTAEVLADCLKLLESHL